MGATEDSFAALAKAAGVELDREQRFGWLTCRGHLEPSLSEAVPEHVLAALQGIFSRLGGDEVALAGKRLQLLRPDFFDPAADQMVELDEVQHFTSDRLSTFEDYPSDVPLGYDLSEYRAILGTWRETADRYRVAKQTVDFPRAGGRRAQRAYFDALRDLAAPYFIGPVIRVPAPEASAARAYERLVDLRR